MKLLLLSALGAAGVWAAETKFLKSKGVHLAPELQMKENEILDEVGATDAKMLAATNTEKKLEAEVAAATANDEVMMDKDNIKRKADEAEMEKVEKHEEEMEQEIEKSEAEAKEGNLENLPGAAKKPVVKLAHKQKVKAAVKNVAEKVAAAKKAAKKITKKVVEVKKKVVHMKTKTQPKVAPKAKKVVAVVKKQDPEAEPATEEPAAEETSEEKAEDAADEKAAEEAADADAETTADEAEAEKEAESDEAKSESSEEGESTEEAKASEETEGESKPEETKAEEKPEEDTTETAEVTMAPYVPPPVPPTPAEKLEMKIEKHEEEKKKEIKEEEEEVAKETQSEALGHMLGDMREEQLEIDEKLVRIGADIDNGIKLEEEKSAADFLKPYPLSSTMKAIINLAIQYFVIYTALAVIRTFSSMFNIVNSTSEQVFKTACDTVNYAPMLCVLFLGARMRALQITQGEGDPQDYCRLAMEMCAWSVMVQTLLVLLIPVLTGEVPGVDADGNVQAVDAKKTGHALFGILNLVRYTAMLSLYGGFSLVCVAVFTMDAETLDAKDKTLWDDPKTEDVELAPPVSPAVNCTMNLTVQYFAIYLALAIVTTLSSMKKESQMFKTMYQVLNLAKYTVNMAPMLCILFIGARMRALQIDPVHGSPQPWAQFCFFLCAYSVLVQTLMVLFLPLIGGNPKAPTKDSIEGDIQFDAPAGAATYVLVSIRYAALLALYGGFTVVIISVLIIEAPHGMPTPPVSPAMQCVMNLTCQYFAVYMMFFMAQTFSQLTGRANKRVMDTLSAATKSVIFCPMLSILFVGARMRALQLSQQKGSPQCHAQDAMFLATYATLAQLLMTLLLGVVSPAPIADDGNGSPTVSGGSKALMIAVECVKWFGLIGIYGGAMTVVSSVLTITPQTAFCDPSKTMVPTAPALF